MRFDLGGILMQSCLIKRLNNCYVFLLYEKCGKIDLPQGTSVLLRFYIKKYHQDCINTPSIKKRTQPKDSHMSEPPHHRITKRAGHKRKKGAEFALHNGELTSFVHFASNTKLELA